MKLLIKLEELALFALGVVAFRNLEYPWWVFLVLLFVPDLSMLGYLAGPRVGSWIYNLVHHRAVAILVYLAGLWLGQPPVQLAGVMLFAHSSMDRVFGYGLKYPDSFQHTHLGRIGGTG